MLGVLEAEVAAEVDPGIPAVLICFQVHFFVLHSPPLSLDEQVVRCSNKGWRADKLEAIVWGKLVAYLGDRDLIIAELEKEKQAAGQTGAFETELKQVERQLKAAEHEQHQLLQWALKGFPENQVEAENQRLNKAKETLKAQKTELEAQLKASQNAVINVPNLERFIEDMQKRLPELAFEGKRLALDMLDITVWLDGDNVEITGVLDSGIVLIPSSELTSPSGRTFRVNPSQTNK
jgi:hypothetical protein